MENFGIIPINDFAKSIKKCVKTLYTLRNNGQIPEKCFKKIGKSLYVRVEEMKEWLNQD